MHIPILQTHCTVIRRLSDHGNTGLISTIRPRTNIGFCTSHCPYVMDRSNSPIVFYNPAGVRKKSANQTQRVAVRWIQEFPNQGPAASRADTSSRIVDEESAEARESRIYRKTATGEKQLRAPLLNAFLLADAPLRLSIGSQRDPFSTLPVPWKPPYGIITSYCKITGECIRYQI